MFFCFRIYQSPPEIFLHQKAEMKYLSLEHLGAVLKELGTKLSGINCNILICYSILFLKYEGKVQFQRSFPKSLKVGTPNLIVVSSGKYTIATFFLCYYYLYIMLSLHMAL